MRATLLALTLICYTCHLSAQDNAVETEIRRLEQLEVQAVLQKDSAMLLKLWDAKFTVNAPNNTINFGGKTTLDRPVLRQPRASFTREVEYVTIKEMFAFSMGSETVITNDSQNKPGQPIKRRFTNIWEKQPGGWKLVGRHANVICTSN